MVLVRQSDGKTYIKCKRCGKLFNKPDPRGSAEYCEPCKPLKKSEYERNRYQNMKKMRMEKKTNVLSTLRVRQI